MNPRVEPYRLSKCTLRKPTNWLVLWLVDFQPWKKQWRSQDGEFSRVQVSAINVESCRMKFFWDPPMPGSVLEALPVTYRGQTTAVVSPLESLVMCSDQECFKGICPHSQYKTVY